MDEVLNLRLVAENYVEGRCCGKYKVWVPAQPESLVAVKNDIDFQIMSLARIEGAPLSKAYK